MAAASTLLNAAQLASGNLYTLWIADTLATKVAAFATAANAIFPETTPNNQPIGNWIAVIAALAPTILAFEPDGTSRADGSVVTYNHAVDAVYRICKLGWEFQNASPALITGSQATQLLAAYNAQFA